MESILLFITVAFGALLVFIILREVFLWYWRIPTLIKNREEQNRLLRKIAGEDPLEEKKPESKWW